MSNKNENGNVAKPMLAEVFTGKISEIREFFNRKWCRMYNIDESKWKHIAPSSIDGLKIETLKVVLKCHFGQAVQEQITWQ